MSYLIMVVMGFIMVGIGTAGYLNNNVIVKHMTIKETYLVDGKGDVVTQFSDDYVFGKYELTVKEKQ